MPDAFRAVQWTRLPDGVPTAEFVARVSKLLGARQQPPTEGTENPPGAARAPMTRKHSAPWRMLAMSLFVVVLGAGYFIQRGRHHSEMAPSSLAPDASRPSTTSTKAAIPEKSVAVLPFVDMSEKHDQEYFSDGMAEEVIDLLVKIPGLRVPARSSSFYFKGKLAKVQDIASELGVANVLEGTVRKRGDHLRVTAQLVQATTGYSLWSQTYDRQMRDVFKTQDEIAAAVVKALKVSLLEPPADLVRPTRNDEAYELYLQARALASTGATPNMAKAYADLKRAVSLDPGFALAWAGIAQLVSDDGWDLTSVYGATHAPLQLDGWLSIWAAAQAEARDASSRAVELAPNSAEAHFAKATVLSRLDWDWSAAEIELARARTLAPDDTRIMLAAAQQAIQLGRIPEGIELAKHAELLDPLGKARKLIGMASAAAGDLATAESSARRFVELYPTEEDAYFNLGSILLQRGDAQSALDVYRRSPSTTPYLMIGPPLALDALGRKAEAEQAMAAAEARFGVDMAYQIAYFYARRGDSALSLKWLERARQQHDGGLARAKIDPMLSSLHGTAGFEDLLRKLHFVP